MKTLFLSLLLFIALPLLHAEDVLFFGNSFTFYNNMPKLVEAIATSKGKALTTEAVTKGGQGFIYHLTNPATDPALKSKAWNFVILQDYSLNATHAPKDPDFLKNGEALYSRVTQFAPQATIILYQTWSYSAKHPFISGIAAPKVEGATEDTATKEHVRFASTDEMFGEIQKSTATLQADLQAKDPKRPVLIAPVGAAFAKCVKEHPEIEIYNTKDYKHPSVAGSYLAACVFYSVLFHDTPVGAAPAGKDLSPEIAKTLQQIAASVVTP